MIFLFKKNKFLRAGFFALFLFLLTFLPIITGITYGQTATPEATSFESATKNAINILEDTAEAGKITNASAPSPNIYQIIGSIINIILGFVGVIFLVLTIASGFFWMTAGGNEEKVKKGRELLTHSVIGLAIILAAFLLTNFIIIKLILGLWMD